MHWVVKIPTERPIRNWQHLLVVTSVQRLFPLLGQITAPTVINSRWLHALMLAQQQISNIEAYISDADTIFGTPTQNTGYGIDFNHDLGGGTSLRGGVAKLFAGHTVADLGVRFNF